jgi:hypothetical protein
MFEERIHGSLDDIYATCQKNQGQLIVKAFVEEGNRTEETREVQALEVCLPLTPVGREVARLISESGLNLYSNGSQSQRFYPTRCDLKKLKLIRKKHGQQELIRLSREKYLLIWLSVLDSLHQLNWDIRQVYNLGLIEVFRPYTKLALAELGLWRRVRCFPDIENSLAAIINIDDYQHWFLTSNEWQVEDCLNTVAQVPQRSMHRVWAARAADIAGRKNPFHEAKEGASFRSNLIEAALHVLRDFPHNDSWAEFHKEGWNPYVEAFKGVSRAFRKGVDFEGQRIKYQTPIIKGRAITTVEDPSRKYPLKKMGPGLTQRGKYDRKTHKNQYP